VRPMRIGIVLAALSFASGGVVGETRRSPTTKGGPGTLTPDETVCSVFLGKRNYHARANPKAIPYLYTLLSDSSLHPGVSGSVFRVLGYVGTREDARKVIAMAREVKGVLDGRKKQKMIGIMECLGLMTRRGMPKVRAALLEMTRWEYWADGPKWRAEDYLREHPEGRYDGMIGAIRALAVYGDQDVTDQARRLLDRAPDDATRKLLSMSLHLEALQGLARKCKLAETKEIGERDRATLAEIGTYLRSQGRILPSQKGLKRDVPLSPDEMMFVRAMVKQAVAAYESLKASILSGKPGETSSRLLDDGEPLEAGRLERLRAEYEKDLGREAEIFKVLDERQSKPVDFAVRRETLYRAAEMPTDERAVATKTETIGVTFRLSHSAEVGNVLLRRQKGSLTVAKDGTLIVVMKKINGKWYWNPFGW